MSFLDSTFLGIPVLGGMTGGGAATDDAGRRDVVTVSGPGRLYQDSHEVTPRYRRALLLQCLGLAEVLQAFAIVDTLKGRLLPFWLPTWDYDLTTAVAYASGAAALSVQPIRYADLSWPASPARRYIQLRGPSGALYRKGVLSATWPGTGPEVLTLSSSIGENVPAGTTVCFLRYCRLDVDTLKMTFYGAEGYAEGSLPVIEIPQECPE